MRARRLQNLNHIKVKDYGDESVNRLALILDQFSNMTLNERDATLQWLNSKFSRPVKPPK